MNFDFSGVGTACFGGMDFMFNVFPILFGVLFCFILGVFIVVFAGGIRQWNRNNHSPVLTVAATVVAKRVNVSTSHHHHGSGSMGHTSTSSSYYVTFEVESGDRMELSMSGEEYGLLIEGDTGRLTFQGTRFKGFDRT